MGKYLDKIRRLEQENTYSGDARAIGSVHGPSSTSAPYEIDEKNEIRHKVANLPRSYGLQEGPPEWHAEEIARRVVQEGVCIFWSDLFGEMVAFVKDESYRTGVPPKTVAYTCKELRRLFDQNAEENTLRLVHEAKKRGGVVK